MTGTPEATEEPRPDRGEQEPAVPAIGVTELRLVVTAEDYEAALAFYRDTLGLPQRAAFSSLGGRVTILEAGRATLEIADPPHARYIDEVEVGHRVAGQIRVAFQVADAESAAGAHPVELAQCAPRRPGRITADPIRGIERIRESPIGGFGLAADRRHNTLIGPAPALAPDAPSSRFQTPLIQPRSTARAPAWKRLRAPRRAVSSAVIRRLVRTETPSLRAITSSVQPSASRVSTACS